MDTPFLLAPWEVVRGGHMERRMGEVEAEIEAPEVSPFRGKLLASSMKSPFRPLGTLWFRPQDSTDEANFVVGSQSEWDSDVFKPIALHESNDSLENLLPDALSENLWGRLYFLNQQGELIGEDEFAHWQLFVLANGLASWQHLPGDGALFIGVDSLVSFVWSQSAQPEMLAQNSAMQLWNEVVSGFWTKNEDALFSRDWGERILEEKIALSVAFERGSLLEMEYVVPLMILTDREFWEDNKWLRWGITFNSTEKDASNQLPLEFQERNINIVAERKHKTTTQRFRAWKRVLLEHFNPHRAEKTKRHICVDNWIKYDVARTELALLDRPSKHEMLESQVALMEWARNHLSPELLAKVESLDG